MDILSKFERDANIQALKYMISKQMFCVVSSAMLDYRNAIMITCKTQGEPDQTRVIDGQFENKVEVLRKHYEAKGFEVDIFVNIKK